MEFFFLPAVVFLVSLFPAIYTLWSERQLVALDDDPVFAERLFAQRKRSGVVTGVCLTVLPFTGGIHFIWAWPMLVIARLAAGYPSSRRIHQETWTLGGYLSFFGRLILAVYGYWMLLAATPALISAAPGRGLIAAAVLAIVLAAWARSYETVAGVILRAHPLDHPALATRFAQLVDACGLRNVSLKQVDVNGGVFANAVALASSTRPTVMVSSTLVERFDEDEVAAIFAHELAHLEHFNQKRLRRLRAFSIGLIAAATLTVPVVAAIAPNALAGARWVWPVLLWIWPALLFTAIMVRAARQQANETASDLRAVALTGDPGALIRALIKLHAMARMPRRWDPEVERHSTHPSLARRIQAIEAAGGRTAARLAEAATVHAAEGAASVTLSDESVSWSEDAVTRHTLAYSALTTLRVEAGRQGAAQLVAIDTRHRRWSMPLRPEDIGRIQAVLDVVDTRLSATAPKARLVFGVPRVVAWITLILAVSCQQFGLALLSALAVACPALPLLVATATAAAAGAALMLGGEDATRWGVVSLWMALLLAACAVALLALSAGRKREPLEGAAAWLVGAAASVASLLWILIVWWGVNLIDLHASNRHWPAAGVLTLSVAAAFAVSKQRALRYAAAPVVLAGCVALFLGSTTFLDHVASDPLLVPASPYEVTTLDRAPIAEVEIEFEASDLRLSPAAGFLALVSEDEDEEITIHAGATNGPFSSFAADDALFAGEGRLLLLERDGDLATLKLMDLAVGRTLWSLRSPVTHGQLAVDAGSQKWSLLGWNEGGDIVEATGAIGAESFEQHVFKRSMTSVPLRPIAASGRGLLAMQTLWQQSPFTTTTLGRLLRPPTRSTSTFSVLDTWQRTEWMTSRLSVQCEAFGFRTGAAICAAFDGVRTSFVALNPASGQREAMGSLEGRFFQQQDAGQGWISGWWRRGGVLIHPESRTVIRLAVDDTEPVMDLAIAGTTIGALSYGANGSRVRLYARD